MPDREKVIKALEHHKETAVCNGCPYAEDDDTPQGNCPVYDDAIALLREQDGIDTEGWTASTQLVRKYMERSKELEARLRELGQPRLSNTEDKDKPLRIMRHSCGAVIVYRGRDVCPNCGKAVDWGV